VARLVRFIVALALGAIGFLISLPSLAIGTQNFDGAVLVVPAQVDQEMFVTVSYEPDDADSLFGATSGDVSIAPSNGDQEPGVVSYWYILLTGDARLSNPRFVEGDGTSRYAQFTEDQFGVIDGVPFEYQLFQFASHDRGYLTGTPQRSPLSRVGDTYSLTMPRIVAPDPIEGPDRDGGVILTEEVGLALLVANVRPPVGDGWDGWQVPRTTRFMLDSGLSETDTVSVTRSAPELDRDKWGQLVIWLYDYPLEATALFEDSADVTAASTRSSWSFLFYGAALPLLIEAALSRRRQKPRAPQAVNAPEAVRVETKPPTPPKSIYKRSGKRRNRSRGRR
jgi:hypothetical protein